MKDPALKEMEKAIRNDCVRTFSHMLFFKSQVIQDMIIRLLLVFAADNPSISYKQGMTDVVAILLLCLYCDHAKIPVNDENSSSFHQHTVTILDSHLKFHSKQYEESKQQFIQSASSQQLEELTSLHQLTATEFIEHDCFIMLTAIVHQIQGCYVEKGHPTNLNSRISTILSIVNQYDSMIISHMEVSMIQLVNDV